MKKPIEQVITETRKLLDIIERKELTRQESEWIISETVRGFRDHVNPGFLNYRKSVSNDYAAVEWRDGGSTFTDASGVTRIDCLGGFGIYNVGHRHPKVLKAVRDQLDKQAIHSQDLLDPLRAMLASLLADITPGELQFTFFTNSGTESIEGAMKLARLHTGRKSFIAAVRGFHGKSLGSLSATAKSTFRQPFLPLIQQVIHVPFNDVDALAKALDCASAVGDDIAGVILEPIQGEGGVYVATHEYMRAARELSTKYGAMLILDEVQTGMGRTGKMFCCEQFGIVPDILCLAKALGGGVMPIGAFMSTAEIWHGMIPNPFIHTTTFGGNPLSCAAAIATINVLLEERLPERAAEIGAWFMPQLQEIVKKNSDLCMEARGMGLLIGLEFHTNEIGWEVVKAAFDRGVLFTGTLINAKTIRIEPPLTIGKDELQKVLSVLQESLDVVRQSGILQK